MKTEDMRRKGSWAVRFYGRSGTLPPLQDKHGKPTRFALTAAAWGETVPRTVSAARKIAAKGRRLLKRAKSRNNVAKDLVRFGSLSAGKTFSFGRHLEILPRCR